MDVEVITRSLAALALILGIINTIGVWMSKGGREMAVKVKDVRAEIAGGLKEVAVDLDDHERRIQTIEGEMRHLPSKDDVSGLKLQLSDLNGQLTKFDSELGSVARTVRRIEDHMMGDTK